jgi:hypothetical protein
VVILHFSTEREAIAACGAVGWVKISKLTSKYEAERIFRRRTRAAEGVRCRELAQSSGMLIELIMFSAVVVVGIALLVPDSIKRVYPITTSRKVMVRAHLPTPLVLGGVKVTGSNHDRCATDRSAMLGFCSSSHLYRTSSRSICERVSKRLREATSKPLHTPKENYSIPTVAFGDVRDELPAHNRRVLS